MCNFGDKRETDELLKTSLGLLCKRVLPRKENILHSFVNVVGRDYRHRNISGFECPPGLFIKDEHPSTLFSRITMFKLCNKADVLLSRACYFELCYISESESHRNHNSIHFLWSRSPRMAIEESRTDFGFWILFRWGFACFAHGCSCSRTSLSLCRLHSRRVTLRKLCMEPTSFTVKAESPFKAAARASRTPSSRRTLWTRSRGPWRPAQGRDRAASRVPFLFTVEELGAEGAPEKFGGSFLVPRTEDPRSGQGRIHRLRQRRGFACRWNTAALTGTITFSVAKSDSQTGEIAGTFETLTWVPKLPRKWRLRASSTLRWSEENTKPLVLVKNILLYFLSFYVFFSPCLYHLQSCCIMWALWPFSVQLVFMQPGRSLSCLGVGNKLWRWEVFRFFLNLKRSAFLSFNDTCGARALRWKVYAIFQI